MPREYIISDERKAELDAMYSPDAEIARLQEQVETLTAQLADMTSRYNKACVDIDAKDYRAEAAEAERDRLREQLEGRDKFIVDQGLWAAFVASLPAALQKEHQP